MQTQQSYFERDVAKNEIRRSADVAKSEARIIKDCKSVVNFLESSLRAVGKKSDCYTARISSLLINNIASFCINDSIT